MTISDIRAAWLDKKLTKQYQQLAGMKRVNRASDDAAGLAIIQKLNTQTRGYNAGYENAAASQDMLKTAEGGLGSITDSLQKIRDLSVQSLNGTYGADEKMAIQNEIDGLKSSIQDAAKGTEFNTMKLLNGSMAESSTAINPDGSGMKIQMANSTLESLGIADYDVTKKFNLNDIDKALKKVSENRSDFGASMNRLDHAMNYNQTASINLTASQSRIEDLDVGKAVSDMQKNKILLNYQMFAKSAQLKAANQNMNQYLLR